MEHKLTKPLFDKEQFFKHYNLFVILGPTASGKTSLAAKLAYLVDGEILSADSRQIYQGMDIGTGKDLEDYVVNGKQITYHLIDLRKAGEKYNVFEYQRDFFKKYNDILKRNKFPIMCGGTGLYIDAIVRNYNLLEVPANTKLRQELENKTMGQLIEMLKKMKKLHNKTDIDTKKRVIRAIEIEMYYKNHPLKRTNYPHINPFVIGIIYNRQTEKQRITERLEQRLDKGMIEEVQKLLDTGLSPESLIYYGLEYKYITLYLTGKLNYEQMVKKLNTAILKFAKRQRTWFRRMEKLGVKIHWIKGEIGEYEKILKIKELVVNGISKNSKNC